MTQSSEPSERRTVVVTGGTSGLGLGIAIRLAERGSSVCLLSRDATNRSEAIDVTFRDLGLPAPRYFNVDVASRAQLEAVADRLASDGVDVGVVVASAGTNTRELALDVADEDVRRMIDVNLYGLIATFQVFAPLVLAGPNGRFIAVSSLNAVHGMRLRAPYSATKAGVSGLVRALAQEWSPLGATVNAIAPGVIETPLTSSYMREHPERAEALRAHTPVGRLGSVADVAHTAEYLASEESGFVTGQTLVLDGGVSTGSSWW